MTWGKIKIEERDRKAQSVTKKAGQIAIQWPDAQKVP